MSVWVANFEKKIAENFQHKWRRQIPPYLHGHSFNQNPALQPVLSDLIFQPDNIFSSHLTVVI